MWILFDEEEIISQAHPNLKEIEHNMGGGERHQNGVKEYEKDVVQSYLVIFWCCQYCKAKSWFAYLIYWREIYFYINVPCMYIKIFWKGHVVMPEIVYGSYHLTNFYAV